MMKKIPTGFLIFCAIPALCQTNSGELRLRVTDSSGHPVEAQVQIVSEANQYSQIFTTGAQGNPVARRLPYGLYQIQIQASSFAPLSELVAIHSALAVNRIVQLQPATVRQSVTVHANGA